jgi:nitroreductase
MIRNLILKNRSYRRFAESVPVPLDALRHWVDLARLSPSGGNMQALKFILSNDARRNALIFPHLSWAGYLPDWPGPAGDERPAAYIVVLGDTQIKKGFGCDHGIAAQSILLGAVEHGFGGCIIGSIDRDALQRDLEIPARYEILLVIALGQPAETVVIESVKADGDIRYWRSKDDVHHVPKRDLDDIILNLPEIP